MKFAGLITSFPGFAIFFTVLSFNLLGDFLRDIWTLTAGA